jgi:hypothetical protein
MIPFWAGSHTYMFIQINEDPYMHAYVVYISMYMSKYLYIYKHIYVQASIFHHMYMYPHLFIYIYIYVFKCKYIFTFINLFRTTIIYVSAIHHIKKFTKIVIPLCVDTYIYIYFNKNVR